VEQQQQPGSLSSRQGYVIVLVGAFAFVVSCFLPYFHLADGTYPTSPSWGSFYRLEVLRPGGTAFGHLGGFLFLFAGIATIASIALAGLSGARRWTSVALVAVAIAWSLTWIGTLLNFSQLLGPSRGVGYWLQLISVLVVAGGTIRVWSSVRREALQGSPATP